MLKLPKLLFLALILSFSLRPTDGVSQDDYRAAGYLYLSPLPDAPYTSPDTCFVLVRFKDIAPSALTNLADFIQVTGDWSGPNPGDTRIASDGRTVIFTMTNSFTPGELVTVSLAPAVADNSGPLAYQYQFAVSGPFPGAQVAPVRVATPNSQALGPDTPPARPLDVTAAKGVAGIMPNGVSVPSDFPWITITVNSNADPNPIFLDNRQGGGKPYNVIFNNDGSPIWYMRTPAEERSDMKVQTNGVLTMIVRTNENHFIGLDQHYQLIATYWATNGYSVDEHELRVLPDGTYFLITLRGEFVDMSRYVDGGDPDAGVVEDAIQEFTPEGDLIFQWRAWEHLDVLDEQEFIDLTSGWFDFPHMNAIDVDTDGHILLSSRSTSEITKIDRDSGDIIWRLGGVHNQFNLLNDPLDGPRNQHSIRVVTTNDYILFDNGNLHNPPMSRALEYRLDLTNMTAQLVWQYPDPPDPDLFTWYNGNVQHLTNGNTLINFAGGIYPKLTEVRPDGTVAYEMNWADQWETYRVWRCPWQGSALQPYLIVEPNPDNISLIFNQFGDTNVAFYKIYGDTSPEPTNLLAASAVTFKRLTELQNGTTYYFRVTAVNQQGVEGPFSNEESVNVSIIQPAPGQNMVQNSDFSQGTVSWILSTSGAASASWSITNNTALIHIASPGVQLANVQLRQAGLELLQDTLYVLQFDAWSSVRRGIEVRLGHDASPLNTYYVAWPSLTTSKRHFTYSFVMQGSSDLDARLMFDVGAVSADIYLDNISLISVPRGDLNLDARVDLLDLQNLSRDWLKSSSGLSSDLDGNGKVDFNDFGIVGDHWSGGN
jgi:hypothetical protein